MLKLASPDQVGLAMPPSKCVVKSSIPAEKSPALDKILLLSEPDELDEDELEELLELEELELDELELLVLEEDEELDEDELDEDELDEVLGVPPPQATRLARLNEISMSLLLPRLGKRLCIRTPFYIIYRV